MSILAVIVSAASCFLLGGLWYSPALFGKAWMARAAPDSEAKGHPARVFAVSILFSIVAAVAFDLLLPDGADLLASLRLGLLLGLGCAATSFGINYQFADRGVVLWMIDGGYHAVQFLLYGLAFGLLG